MLKSKNYILVSIALLIFVGQALASNIRSCNMPAEMMAQTQSEINHDMSSMNHAMNSSTTHSMDSSTGSSMDDCCSSENHCNMSSCFTLALSDETQFQVHYFSHKTPYFTFTMAPSLKPSSLYRPPILV